MYLSRPFSLLYPVFYLYLFTLVNTFALIWMCPLDLLIPGVSQNKVDLDLYMFPRQCLLDGVNFL